MKAEVKSAKHRVPKQDTTRADRHVTCTTTTPRASDSVPVCCTIVMYQDASVPCILSHYHTHLISQDEHMINSHSLLYCVVK